MNKKLMVLILACIISSINAQTMVLNNFQYEYLNGQWYQIQDGRQFPVNNSIISVRFLESVTQSKINDLLNFLELEFVRVNIVRVYDLKIPDNSDPLLILGEIINTGLVEFAVPNHYGFYTQEFPNDQEFINNNQWYHYNENDVDIDTPEAWGIETGASDVIIAILDSGTEITHEDLENNIWINQSEIPIEIFSLVDINNDGYVTSSEIIYFLGNSDFNDDGFTNLTDALHTDSPFTNNVDDDDWDEDPGTYVDDIVGWDFPNDNNDVNGEHHHGTFVAGIPGGVTNNGLGIAGVAGGWGLSNPGIKLMICAVGDSGPDDAIVDDALLYAAAVGADVITMSLGFSESNDDIILAINEANNNYGCFIDCSAGNTSCGDVIFPANAQYVMSVGREMKH